MCRNTTIRVALTITIVGYRVLRRSGTVMVFLRKAEMLCGRAAEVSPLE